MLYWKVGDRAPLQVVQSPVEGRLVVQANDERWRANLGVARDAGQVETKASPVDGELRLADDREILLIT